MFGIFKNQDKGDKPKFERLLPFAIVVFILIFILVYPPKADVSLSLWFKYLSYYMGGVILVVAILSIFFIRKGKLRVSKRAKLKVVNSASKEATGEEELKKSVKLFDRVGTIAKELKLEDFKVIFHTEEIEGDWYFLKFKELGFWNFYLWLEYKNRLLFMDFLFAKSSK